jgi:acyl-CoA synthetase (NDP forming)
MDLFEYQGKQYFAKYNIPVSAGGVAHTVDEAVAEAEKAQYPVVARLAESSWQQILMKFACTQETFWAWTLRVML